MMSKFICDTWRLRVSTVATGIKEKRHYSMTIVEGGNYSGMDRGKRVGSERKRQLIYATPDPA